ncbi:MAG: lactate utilization protein [Clostridiales bacterium]|nr:lactate utilization protein [Clostridiales bacterium]
MDFIKIRNDLLGKTLVENFNKRFFESYYCSTKEEAKDKALSLIKEGSSVSFGGSMSLSQCGLLDAVKSGNFTVYDRNLAKTPEEREEIMRKAFIADTFLMSANAVSQEGELVNIDGLGNRVSALCFGPKQIIVIVGLNKVAPDLDSAIVRARNVASPINTQRFNLDTPCTKKGACYDCKASDCICAQIVITRICRPKGRIKVIFCGEDLGF